MSNHSDILFSTFEPSGDALAAHAVTALRRDAPQLQVYALGGAKMRAAGAELIEQTTQHSSMFFETLAQAGAHRRRLRVLKQWLLEHPIEVFVPVDSPAANWSICRLVRRTRPEAKIVHLAAPQVWAWAPWRVRRLRRLTDHVLCLLPFEPEWFAARGVPATFVGHPIFDAAGWTAPGLSPDLPQGRPRLALLPGSRRGEVNRNWPTMLETFVRLRRWNPDLRGAVAALDDRIARLVHKLTIKRLGPSGWPDHLTLLTDQTDAVLDWCDMALAVSGTVTLQVAARLKPMVIMYNITCLALFVFGPMVRTRTYTLPNLVSKWAGLDRAAVELVPHFGSVKPVVHQIQRLLKSKDAARQQRARLALVTSQFNDRHFATEASRQILSTLYPTSQ